MWAMRHKSRWKNFENVPEKKKKKVQITELIAKGSTADPRREASGSPSERRMNVHCVHSLLYMYKQFCECCGKTASSQPLSRGREEPRSEKAIPKWVYPRVPPPPSPKTNCLSKGI